VAHVSVAETVFWHYATFAILVACVVVIVVAALLLAWTLVREYGRRSDGAHLSPARLRAAYQSGSLGAAVRDVRARDAGLGDGHRDDDDARIFWRARRGGFE
jgi:membrane protein implicated in regulation of membrane protease activity